MNTFGRLRCVLICGLLLSAAPAAAEPLPQDAWPGWRGPTRDGQSIGPSWPDKLADEHLEKKWRVELGPSYSGPLVVGERVFVTETRDGEREAVQALDRKSGEAVWEAEWKGAMRVPFFARANGSWIRSTPACDGETLYVGGMRDVLVALDVASGEERWRVDFVQKLDAPLPAFGLVCSPLLVGDHLYLQAGASLVKLDKRSGQVVWRSLEDKGGMYGSAFSSPVLTNLAGREQLVVQTREKLAGIDPSDGAILWSEAIKAFRGMNILTPTLFDGRILTSAYGGRTHMIEVENKEEQFTTREAWDNKAQGYMSSPVVIDGHAYLHLKSRRLTCVDLKSGESTWTSEPFGKYWSMIARGDKILALDERGELLLLRANPERLEILDRREVSEAPTWAHLAVSGDDVVIRELHAVAAYRWK